MTQATRSRTRMTAPPTVVRAAVYTRKSTTHGLDSDFSSLDAQREACETYIKSQASLGWTLVPKEYSDGGYTGANTDRPAFQRLRQDIEAGEIDAVVVYKLDRLSRSVVDLHQTVRFFESRHVAFVSVTQRIDTSGSAGKLLLNMLAAVAEFERDMIADRTRDKITAARRRGKWTGGTLVLGYTLDKDRRGLVIADDEAELVRKTFDMYLRMRSTRSVADELNALGYRQKRFATRGGKPWDKHAVGRLLRNPLYSGQIREGDALRDAEHPAIVARDMYDRAQTLLDERSTGRGPRTSRKSEYLLTGLLRCGPCNSALTSSLARGRRGVKYRYYRCRKENAHGSLCPTGLLPAQTIESAVIAEVRRVAASGEIPRRIREKLLGTEAVAPLLAERERYDAEKMRLQADARRLLDAISAGSPGASLVAGRLGEIEEAVRNVERKLAEIAGQIQAIDMARQDAEWVAEALGAFDQVWDALVPAERRELLHVVVKAVAVGEGRVRIEFHDFEEATSDLAIGKRA